MINVTVTRGMQYIVGASVISCPDLGQGEIYRITYVPYIHIENPPANSLVWGSLRSLQLYPQAVTYLIDPYMLRQMFYM